jgi:NAD+-dependent protein deacetylase sirtuin 2
VFFGEQLPDRFYDAMASDLPAAELLLVMGTSLVVQPFASLIGAVEVQRVGLGSMTV